MVPLNKRRHVVNGYLSKYCADYNLCPAHPERDHTKQGRGPGRVDGCRYWQYFHCSSRRRAHPLLGHDCVECYFLCPGHNAPSDCLIEWISSERPFDPRGSNGLSEEIHSI